MNRRTLKTEKLLSSSPPQESAPITIVHSYLQLSSSCDENALNAKGPNRPQMCTIRVALSPHSRAPTWTFPKIWQEKRAQTQTSGFGYPLVGAGLPREGVGAKKFGMSLETQENIFFVGCPRNLPGYHPGVLMAPYRAILRYYRCNTSYRTIPSEGGSQSLKTVRELPWVLRASHSHVCAITHGATYRAMIVRYPKNKHKRGLRYYRYKYRAL